MQKRIFPGRPPSAYRALTQRIALIAFALTLAGCASAPAPIPAKPPSLAERQVETLQSLGFVKKDPDWQLSLPEKISFESSKADLKPEMQKNLDGFAEQLLKVEIRHLRIEGHSDNIGQHAFNIDLSHKRADAVARTFLIHGFADSDVERLGWGPDHPIANNNTHDGRAQNRRVEIIVPLSALAPQP